MTDEDKKRFAAMMGALGVAFDLTVTQQRMAIYFEALTDLRIEALEWAAKEAVARLKFFPRAAELRELAGIAPLPAKRRLSSAEEPKQLEELEPAEVVAQRLESVAERLNRRYGTSFRVSEEKGRPVLVGGSGERCSC